METTSHRPHKQPRTLAGEQQGRQHDLLHFKLQTEIRGDQTEHTYFEPSLVAHGRLMRRKEVWRRERILGQGSYGTVYRERLEGGLSRLRAVKQIRKGVVASEALEYTRELEAAVIFSRPKYSHCFARSNGWFENDQFVFIAMEYLELGDLQRYLNRPLPELETRAITSQVLEGLEYMHEKGFIHRDLKPGNLLVVSLAPNWHVKIADFGISKRQFDHGVSNTLEVGTFAFAAPEQLGLGESAGSYTCSVDMWSLGAVAYRILTGTNAFHGLSELVKYIGGKSPFPVGALQAQHMSVSGLDFVLRLMSPVPESRLSAVDADRHPWLAKPILSKETPVLLPR
ncbi:kinase-like domain-containing protein [Cladorrhinum sp. PSN259]|nr:kinase-like domain-containing protein [Cladorrhinum sp. PSN259]